MPFVIHAGNNLDILPTLPDNSVDSIVTDPPYELGFMGKKWDNSGIAYSVELWKECLRVLKPGGHLLSFGGTRTWHRLAVAIEDAGFDVRDSIAWMYGSGFPKSHNLKDDWQGWGTALKPAFEPIVVARKPLIGTVAANVLEHGTGALNIDGSRIGTEDSLYRASSIALPENQTMNEGYQRPWKKDSDKVAEANQRTQDKSRIADNLGRWPANVILDEYSAAELDEQSDSSRFFYCAKASKRDRNEGLEGLEAATAGEMVDRVEGSAGMNSPRAGAGRTAGSQNFHPTVKPTNLMRYLVKLVTPPGGTVLDPFTGSGSTGKAAILEGFDFIGIELTEEYLPIIEGRLAYAEQMMLDEQQKKDEGLF